MTSLYPLIDHLIDHLISLIDRLISLIDHLISLIDLLIYCTIDRLLIQSVPAAGTGALRGLTGRHRGQGQGQGAAASRIQVIRVTQSSESSESSEPHVTPHGTR